MKLRLQTALSIVALGATLIGGCTVTSTTPAPTTTGPSGTAPDTGKGASGDGKTPTQAPAEYFAQFTYKQDGTAHRYLSGRDAFDSAAGPLLVNESIYLSADKTFVFFYDEGIKIDESSSKPVGQRKIKGVWSVEGATLKLGNAATCVATKVQDFGKPRDAVGCTLTDALIGKEAVGRSIVSLYTSSNVGPDAPFWSDYN